jgi:putative ABC transport system permease protein
VSWWQQLVRRVTGRADADLDREIRAHLEAEADDQQDLHDGLTRAAAREAARRAFGSTALTKDAVRDAWGWTRVEQILQDVRFAVRTLRRSPAFTIVAVLSLALGIGANTTIFTFLNAIVLRPLPYHDPDRIIFIQERPLQQDRTVHVHPFNFLQWKARARSIESLALAQMIPFNTMGPDGAEQAAAMMTTVELFRVLDVAPALGRWFTAEEATFTGGPSGTTSRAVVVSYEFWQRRLNADPHAIGKTLMLNNTSRVVVGVAPPRLRVGTLTPELYVPLAIDPAKPDSIGSRSFLCFGRVRPDRDAIAARAELTAIAEQLSRETPIDKNMGVSVLRLHDFIVQNSRAILALLMGVVLMVLLIACLNLASLLLTRGVGRQHELAIRASLGAGRLRLVQQLVIESLVLAAAGGALGLLLAHGSTRVLLALTKTALTFGRLEEVQIEWRVLVFTIALSTLTALLCGLLPAWSVARVDPQAGLRDQGRGRSGSRRHARFRSALVIAEVALAVVLLVGSGLLLRTFSKMLQIDLGFKPEHILTMRMFLTDDAAVKRATLIDRMLDRIDVLPEVVAASTIRYLPVAGSTSGTGVRVNGSGSGSSSPSDWKGTEVSIISRGYFQTMGMPVLEGRAFEARDRLDSPRVAMVNRAFVRRYFPDGRALGRSITVQWEDEVPSEIIGVVGDVSYSELTTEARPMVYLAHAQSPGYLTHLVIRTSGDPLHLAAAVRHEVQAVDPTKAVSNIKTMEDYVDESLARPRLYASMMAAFAALALLLAGIGLYGLIAYGVSQRTHEIGIRMALGAQRGDVTRAVLFQGAGLAAAGLAGGIASALAFTHLLQNLLFGVTPTDAATFLAVACVLAAVALTATFIPARRAARVDPVIALRYD